jgi:hypothetical protein
MGGDDMKKVNSISGGKTSAYIAANYEADFNVFSLVRTDDENCLFPDKKLRQMVEDRIQKPFIGTLEMDTIIHTMFDLEQFIGSEITWVTGITFDEIIKNKGGYLPNKTQRYCTTNLKLIPIFEWWYKNINEPVEMRIGYRANEMRRAVKMQEKLNENGLLEIKHTVKKNKNGTNHWETFEWQQPSFPLITDNIYKDQIEEFWKDKPVRFAEMNNCVGCFHRNELLLRKMFDDHQNKMNWFKNKEVGRGGKGTWKTGITYSKIKKHKPQIRLDFSDFSDCDSGFCGM